MSERDAETNAFVLSRIYGQGWTAARRMLASSNSDVRTMDAPAHNPYRGGEERSRWEKGFIDALESPGQQIAVTARKSWRHVNKRDAAK